MVNTFLPFSDFQLSAKCLDMKRLGNQRSEARLIIQTLEREAAEKEEEEDTEGQLKEFKKSWIHHPACQMWRGYVDALKWYYNEMVLEWIHRGYRNTMVLYFLPPQGDIKLPWFFGWEPFHLTHQASLLRKSPRHYRDKFLTDEFKTLSPIVERLAKTTGYIWPSDFSAIDVKEQVMTDVVEWIQKHARPIQSLDPSKKKRKPTTNESSNLKHFKLGQVEEI